MDTNDLKRLFEEQQPHSRITADGVTRRVERQRTLRRAGLAGFVSLAVVGASVGGLWLNSQNRETLPAEPLPAPSVTTPVTPPSTDPTTVEGANTDLVACTIDAPASWVQALQGPFDQAGSTAPWIEKDGSNLTWHRGADSIAFAEDAQVQMGSGTTDGRYVLYWADSGGRADGQAKVWDSHQPDVEPWSLPGTFASDLPMRSFLADGVIWFTQVDDFNQAPEEQVTTVSVIDLAKGREATQLLQEQNLTIRDLFDDGLQVRVGDGAHQLLTADGSLTELPEPLQTNAVAMTSGDVALLHPDNSPGDPSLLYNPQWDGPRAAEGAWMLDGDWVLTSGAGQHEGRYLMVNHTNGVRVLLPEGQYSLRSGYLFTWLPGEETPERPLIALADLPAVACGDAEPAVDPTTEVASEVGANVRSLAAGVECTVDAPESWLRHIDTADDLLAVGDDPWLEKAGTTLTWHEGESSLVIDTDVDPMFGRGHTDGRYVLYTAGAGVQVWDSENPDEEPLAIEGNFGGDHPGRAARLAKGKVWLTEQDVWDQPAADVTTTISVIDLAKGREARQVLQEKDVTVATAYLDGLQVRIGGGEYAVLLADGGLEPLPGAINDKFILDTAVTPHGELALVTNDAQRGPNDSKWVHSELSGDLIEVGNAREVEGVWALKVTTIAMVDHYVMRNVFTGVEVELPWDREQTYMLDEAHLWVPSEKFEAYAPVALSQLEVACP